MLRRAHHLDWRPGLRRFLRSLVVAAQWANWPFTTVPLAWPGSAAPPPGAAAGEDPLPWLRDARPPR